MNSLVMNYLIVEGFQSVAEQFQQEANTKGSVPLSSITGRTSVRSALSAGRIDDGLREINTILPTLLEHNPSLLLQLQQQQLVELIRADKIDEALTFARTHLRAGCADQAHALQALEGIMSLLAFSALPPEHNPMAHLLDQRARVTLAGAVNDAILEGQFACKESQLQRVAKHTIHSQQQLANFLPEFPKLPVDPTAAASSAGATATPASSSGSSSSSRALLDPASLYESLATSEAAARKAAEDKAAAELALVITALEQERAAREERERARRARQAAFAAARAAEPRSAFRHDNPPVEEVSARAQTTSRLSGPLDCSELTVALFVFALRTTMTRKRSSDEPHSQQSSRKKRTKKRRKKTKVRRAPTRPAVSEHAEPRAGDSHVANCLS